VDYDAARFEAWDSTVFYAPPGFSSFLTITLNGGETSFAESHTMYLAADQTVSGYAAYDPGTRPEPGDGAVVEVEPGDNATPSASRTLLHLAPSLELFGSGVIPWARWSYTAPSPGFYTFGYEVQSDGIKRPTGLFTPVRELRLAAAAEAPAMSED
jgi:hypothetical protein